MNNFDFYLGDIPETTKDKYVFLQKLELWSENSFQAAAMKHITPIVVIIMLVILLIAGSLFIAIKLRDEKKREEFKKFISS